MTSGEIARSIQKVLDSTGSEEERVGVIVTAHQIASDCSDDCFNSLDFLRACGLKHLRQL